MTKNWNLAGVSKPDVCLFSVSVRTRSTDSSSYFFSHLMEIGACLENPATPRSNGEILQKTAQVSFLPTIFHLKTFFPLTFKQIHIETATYAQLPGSALGNSRAMTKGQQ